MSRLTDMVAMRGDDMSYAMIGAHFGITKQRVEQIFREHAPECRGWWVKRAPLPKVSKLCPVCGTDFRDKGRQRKTCSARCGQLSIEDRTETVWLKTDERLAMEWADQGVPWRRIARRLNRTIGQTAGKIHRLRARATGGGAA